MKLKVFFPFLIIVSLLISCAAQDSADTRISAIESGLIQRMVQKDKPVETFTIDDRMAHYNVPGVSVAVINNYEIEWAKGYGVKESGSNDPVDILTLFQAASISKPVAALGALLLVQEGKLSLDENVNDKLKSWQVPENEFTTSEKVTLRRLVTHSAGLTVHGFPGYAHDVEVPATVDVLDGSGNTDEIRVDTEPGSKWRYSGGGYTVMQQLVEDISGEPFSDYLKNHVLDTIGMTGSGYFQPITGDYAALAAIAHNSKGEPVEGKWHTYPEKAAAGLWTSPSDLCRYAIEMMLSNNGESNKLLTKETVSEILTQHIGNWGLGPGLNKPGETVTFGHGGSNKGFRCRLIALTNEGKGAVVMTNGDNGSALAAEILRAISKEYGWGLYKPTEVEVIDVDLEITEKYTGDFRVVKYPEMIVRFFNENGKFYIDDEGAIVELFPETETDYIALENGQRLIFKVDESGQVDDAVIRIPGSGEFELQRVK